VDLGCRGLDRDVAPVEVIDRRKFKSRSPKQRTWLQRRQSIEPLIGHTKADQLVDRCWLKGSDGDPLHAVLCAAGMNIRWLMRAITRLSMGGLLLALSALALKLHLNRDHCCSADPMDRFGGLEMDFAGLISYTR